MNGTEMRKLRERLGLTQAELARALNKSFVSINRWESTASPNQLPEDVARLLEAVKALADSGGKSAEKTNADLRDALLSPAGVLGVVTAAARGGLLPKGVLALICLTPGLGWIEAAAGIGVAKMLPFFRKIGDRKRRDAK